MYLPDLMIDLREHFKDGRKVKRDYLSPSAQAVLLRCIIKNNKTLFPGDLLGKVPYSRMTLNRAFDELAHHELAVIAFPGRDKLLSFDLKGKELWRKALPFLRSPVKKTIYTSVNPFSGEKSFLAGLSALAEYSTIAAGNLPVYAIEWNSYRVLYSGSKLREIPSPDGATAAVELWNYSPAILSNSNAVDQLSLYLSLRGNQDERVQGALDSMMEAMIW